MIDTDSYYPTGGPANFETVDGSAFFFVLANARMLGAIMADVPATGREYWIAIRPCPDSDLNIFGPYTLQEAMENRLKWAASYPDTAAISSPFHAETRDLANIHAAFYMPK